MLVGTTMAKRDMPTRIVVSVIGSDKAHEIKNPVKEPMAFPNIWVPYKRREATP